MLKFVSVYGVDDGCYDTNTIKFFHAICFLFFFSLCVFFAAFQRHTLNLEKYTLYTHIFGYHWNFFFVNMNRTMMTYAYQTDLFQRYSSFEISCLCHRGYMIPSWILLNRMKRLEWKAFHGERYAAIQNANTAYLV